MDTEGLFKREAARIQEEKDGYRRPPIRNIDGLIDLCNVIYESVTGQPPARKPTSEKDAVKMIFPLSRFYIAQTLRLMEEKMERPLFWKLLEQLPDVLTEASYLCNTNMNFPELYAVFLSKEAFTEETLFDLSLGNVRLFWDHVPRYDLEVYLPRLLSDTDLRLSTSRVREFLFSKVLVHEQLFPLCLRTADDHQVFCDYWNSEKKISDLRCIYCCRWGIWLLNSQPEKLPTGFVNLSVWLLSSITEEQFMNILSLPDAILKELLSSRVSRSISEVLNVNIHAHLRYPNPRSVTEQIVRRRPTIQGDFSVVAKRYPSILKQASYKRVAGMRIRKNGLLSRVRQVLLHEFSE